MGEADRGGEARDTTRGGGVDRSHGSANAQKLAFLGLHGAWLALAAWTALLGGLETVGGWFGRTWLVAEPIRALLVVSVTGLYWIRHGVTIFYLVERRVTWSEALGLASFLAPVEVGFAVLATGITRPAPLPLGPLDYVALGLVLFGSYLNSGSEIQRKLWKRDAAHKGLCYTEGLFHYSMHINYFGDSLMFTGWCLLTGVLWTLAVAALMTALFIFMHIPGLDRYLEERYGDAFRDYARRTKKFVPWIY